MSEQELKAFPCSGKAEHDEIWLEPICADGAPEGRLWCQDNVFEPCEECGSKPVRFVRDDRDTRASPSQVEIDRWKRIELAAIHLLNFFAKSVNAGPLSKDPSQEGTACRALRDALDPPTPDDGEEN